MRSTSSDAVSVTVTSCGPPSSRRRSRTPVALLRASGTTARKPAEATRRTRSSSRSRRVSTPIIPRIAPPASCAMSGLISGSAQGLSKNVRAKKRSIARSAPGSAGAPRPITRANIAEASGRSSGVMARKSTSAGFGGCVGGRCCHGRAHTRASENHSLSSRLSVPFRTSASASAGSERVGEHASAVPEHAPAAGGERGEPGLQAAAQHRRAILPRVAKQVVEDGAHVAPSGGDLHDLAASAGPQVVDVPAERAATRIANEVRDRLPAPRRPAELGEEPAQPRLVVGDVWARGPPTRPRGARAGAPV